MTWWLFVRIVGRRFRREWMRSLVLALVVAVAVAVVVAIVQASALSVSGFSRGSEVLGGPEAVELYPLHGRISEHALVDLQRRLPALNFVPIVEELGTLAVRVGENVSEQSLIVLGMPLPLDGVHDDTSAIRGLLSTRAARAFAVQHGERVMLTVHDRPIEILIDVRDDLVPSVEAEALFLHIGDLQDALQRPGYVSTVVIEKDNTLSNEAWGVLRQFASAQSLLLSGASERRTFTEGLLKAFRLNLTILIALTTLVAMTLIGGVSMVYFLAHREDFVIVRTLGAPPYLVYVLLLGEAWAIAGAGAVLGVTVGTPLIRSLENLFLATVGTLYLHSAGKGDAEIVTRIDELGIAVAAAIFITTVGTLGPLWQARLVKPSLGRRGGADRAAPSIRKTVGAGLIGAASAFVFGSLAARYQVLWLAHGAAFLVVLVTAVAACIAIRVVLDSPTLRRASWPLLTALGALRASIRPTTVVSVMVAGAISATVGLGFMVGSFRFALTEWLGQTLDADLFIRARAPDDATHTARLSKDTVAAIVKLPGIRAVSRMDSIEAELDGQRLTLMGRELGPGREQVVVLQGSIDWQCFHEGRCVFLSEGLARRIGRTFGQTLVLGGSSFQISAIIQDFATERGALILDYEQLVKRWGASEVRTLALWVDEGESVDALRQEILRATAPARITVARPQELFSRALNIFDETFSILQIVRIILLGMALVGFGLMLLQVSYERRAEVAVLETLGSSGQAIRQMTILQGVVLFAPALLVGTLGGSALGSVLITLVNPLSFGWSFPLQVSFSDLVAIPVLTGLGMYLVTWLVAKRGRTTVRDSYGDE